MTANLPPLAAAEAAKARHGTASEIDALTTATDQLNRLPWLPLRPGDIVLSYTPKDGDTPAHGMTYLTVDGEFTDATGSPMLHLVSTTDLPDNDNPTVPPMTSLYDLWFKDGPNALTVIRGGAVIYGNPARAEVARNPEPGPMR